jgi:hypothetical protein
MLARVKGWAYAVGVGRKHVINWPELMLKAVSGQDGVFKSKAGGSITCDGKVLLRQLVRLENSWRHNGDILGIVRFEEDSLVIPNYFGRDFRIPLRAEGVTPPSEKCGWSPRYMSKCVIGGPAP